MPSLPPLTSLIAEGAAGGHEFERLMNQLLLCYANRQGFMYEPNGNAGGDQGIDGLVRKGNVPGLEGPVAFQFKWLWGQVHKGSKSRQITDSLERAARNREIRHWVLVTPHELTPAEKNWFLSQKPRMDLTLHSWGQDRIEWLLREYCPALFARYYPHEAKPSLDKYDGHDFKQFAADYRRKAAIAHQRLRTIGLPPETLRERDSTAEIPLRTIFVPQTFLADEEPDPDLSLAELLHAHRNFVLLGDPGIGKTTVLAFVALLFCNAAELAGFSPPSDIVPLFVPLRDYLRLRKDRTDLDFLEYLTSRARSDLNLPHAHRAFFEAALRMGETIVLFDGLDESGDDASRVRLSTAIQTFQADFPSCPILVTSRIYSYTRDTRLPKTTFAHYRVGRLTPSQVDEFIERWYTIQTPDNLRERQERIGFLRHAVHHSPSVQRLAGNPLLLTLMAFIHHGQRSLPQDRAELYEQCIQMLLKTWQDAKREGGSPTGDVAESHPFQRLGLHVATQKDYLAHLAMRAQELNQATAEDEGRGLIRRRDALDCLAKRHFDRSRRTRPGIEPAEAREEMEHFLGYVSERTGLLIDKGGGQLSFIHLSFQEYLAAWVFTCSAVNEDEQCRFFLTHLGQSVWEEVLLLRLYIILRLPGGGGDVVFDAIIRTLLAGLEQDSRASGWLTLARAVRDNLEISAEDKRKILQHALMTWLGSPPRFHGPWFNVLEEVCLFSPTGKRELETLLKEYWRNQDLFQTIEKEATVQDRHALAVALGRLGDPRIVLDLRLGANPDKHAGYIRIPPGEYYLGNERRLLTTQEPFWLSRYLVTNSQYAKFVDEGGYARPELWSDGGWRWLHDHPVTTAASSSNPDLSSPSQPVVGVSWWEADAFCRWAGGRLPTAVEWEIAARGPNGYIYPWGDDWQNAVCNSWESGLRCTSAVGIFPRSKSVPFELEDMAGNVWEWCADCDEANRVLCGGSWTLSAEYCRSTFRAGLKPDYRNGVQGFRVAADAPAKSLPAT